MSRPQSIINICNNVRLDSTYNHSIYFESREEQLAYFSGRVIKSFAAYSYVRKSWDLKVGATLEEAMKWGYLYFQNVADGEYYFYFIDDVEYVNDETTVLKLQMDVLQTYLRRIQFNQCFIEREHTLTDVFGEHTIDEGLETGDPIVYYQENEHLGDMAIVVMATINPETTTATYTAPSLGGMYNDVFSGMGLYAVDAADWQALGNKLADLEEWGKIDGIHAMWMYPKMLISLGGESTWDDDEVFKIVDDVNNPAIMAVNIKPETWMAKVFDGYTPRNKKCYCYPYNHLYVTNNTGAAADYRFERFRYFDDEVIGWARFVFHGALAPDAPVKMSPYGYNLWDRSLNPDDVGSTDHYNFEEGLTSSGAPSCAWDADIYKIWMAQNKNQQNVALAGEVAGGVSNIFSGVAGLFSLDAGGNVGNAITGLVDNALSVAQLMAQRKDMQVQPPQARGNQSVNVNFAIGIPYFVVQLKCCSPEYLKAVDDYFTMYGYKVNRIGMPQLKNREHFTYVKTQGCTVRSSTIPSADRRLIQAIFDHGVTWWTSAAANTMGNYGAHSNNPLGGA